LEDRGWLQAEWKESETGREAKFYSLTKKGRRQMDAEILNWERLCNAVGLVLRVPEKES
jgi:DNA-binding PadR family transcriptional regulator